MVRLSGTRQWHVDGLIRDRTDDRALARRQAGLIGSQALSV
jgi:hypothetical protein